MSSSGAAEPFVAGVKLSAEELANAATGPAHAMPDFSASRFTVLNYFRGACISAIVPSADDTFCFASATS